MIFLSPAASRCCNSLNEEHSYSALKTFPDNVVKMCGCLFTQHHAGELLRFPGSHQPCYFLQLSEEQKVVEVFQPPLVSD